MQNESSYSSMRNGDDGDIEEWELPPSVTSTDEPSPTEEELTKDLYKVSEEIRTLKQVLQAKERKAADIRKKLGITPLQLMSKDVASGFKSIKDTSEIAVSKVTNSETVQKINQSYAMQASKNAVSSAASYTKSGFSTLGTGLKSGLGSMKSSKLGSSMDEAVSSLKSSSQSLFSRGGHSTNGTASPGGNESSILLNDEDNSHSLYSGGGVAKENGIASKATSGGDNNPTLT